MGGGRRRGEGGKGGEGGGEGRREGKGGEGGEVRRREMEGGRGRGSEGRREGVRGRWREGEGGIAIEPRTSLEAIDTYEYCTSPVANTKEISFWYSYN